MSLKNLNLKNKETGYMAHYETSKDSKKNIQINPKTGSFNEIQSHFKNKFSNNHQAKIYKGKNQLD